MQKEKEQQDKFNTVKARLLYGDESGRNLRNHEESHYSESKTPTAWTEPRRRHGSKHSRSPSPIASVFRRLRQNKPPSLGPRPQKEGGVFNRGTSPRGNNRYSESEDSKGGHWKSKSKRHGSNTYEDDLSQSWTCEERNPFTPRIRHFDFPRTRMPSHVKKYDGSGVPEDHLKVWFDKLPKESIESYKDLRAAFRENYLQQTKHIKDPVEIHHIKQRDGESMEDFMERYKAEVLDGDYVFSARGIAAFSSHIRKQAPPVEATRRMKQAKFQKRSSKQAKSNGISDRFSLLTKPQRIFSLEKGKFKAPPPMVTPAEKKDPIKYCEFHVNTGHSTDECMQLRKQIGEMIKSGEEMERRNKIIEAEIGGHFITIPTQWNNRQNGYKKDPCRTIHDTRNVKIPSRRRNGDVTKAQVIPMECAIISGPSTQHPVTSQVLEEKIKVAIHPEYPEQTIAIGSTLKKGRKELCALLKQNLDVFAWKPADMTSVPRHIAEHRLNVREGCLPARQKKRGQAPERNKASKEVEKMDRSGIDERRGDVLGLQSKHRRAEKVHKKERFPIDSGSRSSLQTDEETHRGAPNVDRTKGKEELIMYLAAAKEAISAVLMTEREGKQMPVYFVSRALRGPEINYTPMEKLVLALLSVSRRLKRYFQAHTIVVITDQPIKQLLSNSEITGRMLKWKFELEGYDIQYRPKISIKVQILTDFIVKRPEEESSDKLMAELEEPPEP
ncbi:reverse transcriptase domain-containing protein [Tanacetum coccineum]